MSSTTKHFVQLAGQYERIKDKSIDDISLQRVLKGKSNNHIGGVHIDNNTKCD
ncbi:unnamed protein product [Schistosoma curassoni]|uniref:ABC transporter ATP-binding protein n=1 Tax=Schistosoma curassoni TaxID=6186 RepID=A0A183JG77_9TREM|nr:unnamed protein product [Schistosoma curassoni]